MISRDSKSDTLFFQRIEELADRCIKRFSPEFSHFLDAGEQRVALEYLRRYSEDIVVVSFGGFSDAERRVVGLFPRDIYGYVDENELISMFSVKGLEINGSGFSSFSHRDCMGSVLALGVKREAVGDFYVLENEHRAFVCLTDVAAQYVCDNLEFVARDKVNTKIIDAVLLPAIERKFSVISGTVASERLDCIISLATNLSREKAKQLIAAGLVNVNHLQELRCDFQLEQDDVLSVRGYGRYKIAELGGVTRKGRNRVIVHKMI